jgi:hypothetical protein
MTLPHRDTIEPYPFEMYGGKPRTQIPWNVRSRQGTPPVSPLRR